LQTQVLGLYVLYNQQLPTCRAKMRRGENARCVVLRRPCSTALSHAPSLTPHLGSRNRQGKERDRQGKSGTYGEELRSTPTAIKEPTSGNYWESKPSKALCTFSILFSLTLTRAHRPGNGLFDFQVPFVLDPVRWPGRRNYPSNLTKIARLTFPRTH